MGPLFRDLVIGLNRDLSRPVTCIIADATLGFAIDVAEELGIQIFYFRTISACASWAYFCLTDLIEAGELPFKGNDLDVPINSIPGMETFLRRRDLPGICRASDLSAPEFEFMLTETRQTPRTQGLILNTFDDLEGPTLFHIRTQIPNVYTIGPLHAHLKTRHSTTISVSSSSLWEEDRSCMTWLDSQPTKSVIYVSFGSIAILTRDQLMEFWHGLLNSGKRFLWVMRPELVPGGNHGEIPAEVSQGTKERGKLVSWAPQEEVLAHTAVGGFLTHCGWNSTLESIVAGIPMLCWPCFVDQQTNSRFVGHVWKLGLDMKDIGDRFTVAKKVKELMDLRRDELVQSSTRMADLAGKAVSEGGSSYCNLERLIHDIKFMSANQKTC